MLWLGRACRFGGVDGCLHVGGRKLVGERGCGPWCKQGPGADAVLGEGSRRGIGVGSSEGVLQECARAWAPAWMWKQAGAQARAQVK